jgi:hypothetical protein
MASGDTDGENFETVTSFKLGFGGKSLFLPGAYYYVLNPVWRKLFRYGVGRWLDSRMVLKTASLFLGKCSRS